MSLDEQDKTVSGGLGKNTPGGELVYTAGTRNGRWLKTMEAYREKAADTAALSAMLTDLPFKGDKLRAGRSTNRRYRCRRYSEMSSGLERCRRANGYSKKTM